MTKARYCIDGGPTSQKVSVFPFVVAKGSTVPNLSKSEAFVLEMELRRGPGDRDGRRVASIANVSAWDGFSAESATVAADALALLATLAAAYEAGGAVSEKWVVDSVLGQRFAPVTAEDLAAYEEHERQKAEREKAERERERKEAFAAVQAAQKAKTAALEAERVSCVTAVEAAGFVRESFLGLRRDRYTRKTVDAEGSTETVAEVVMTSKRFAPREERLKKFYRIRVYAFGTWKTTTYTAEKFAKRFGNGESKLARKFPELAESIKAKADEASEARS